MCVTFSHIRAHLLLVVKWDNIALTLAETSCERFEEDEMSQRETCRTEQNAANENLLAKFGVDETKNESPEGLENATSLKDRDDDTWQHLVLAVSGRSLLYQEAGETQYDNTNDAEADSVTIKTSGSPGATRFAKLARCGEQIVDSFHNF